MMLWHCWQQRAENVGVLCPACCRCCKVACEFNNAFCSCEKAVIDFAATVSELS